MDRAEREALRKRCVDGWRPGQHVELRVSELAALLDIADQADRYEPDQHHRIAMAHWEHGEAIDGCNCTSCFGWRAQAEIVLAQVAQKEGA